MQRLTLEQVADFLDVAIIEQSINSGSIITHICNVGTSDDPCRFVLSNSASGRSTISPAFFN